MPDSERQLVAMLAKLAAHERTLVILRRGDPVDAAQVHATEVALSNTLAECVPLAYEVENIRDKHRAKVSPIWTGASRVGVLYWTALADRYPAALGQYVSAKPKLARPEPEWTRPRYDSWFAHSANGAVGSAEGGPA